jgi:N-acylneuraminate cytidylyltransferase/CMP-N,N'-diacetyllegionaminic acid synthase
MKILAIIPARAGSKGINDKNIYPCAGKPLIDWTIFESIESNLQDICITTDYEDYFFTPKYLHRKLSKHIRRPYLCEDYSKMIDVIQDIARRPWGFEAYVILQPTSPLRTHEDINKAIELFENSGANSLYSGYYMGVKHKNVVYNKHTSEKQFQRNGAIFIAKRSLIDQGQLWDDTVIEYEMPLSRSIDIDTMDDMYIAEALLEKRLKEVKNP